MACVVVIGELDWLGLIGDLECSGLIGVMSWHELVWDDVIGEVGWSAVPCFDRRGVVVCDGLIGEMG